MILNFSFHSLSEFYSPLAMRNKIPVSQLNVEVNTISIGEKVKINRVNRCGEPLRLTAEFSFTRYFPNAKKRMRKGNKKEVNRARLHPALSSNRSSAFDTVAALVRPTRKKNEKVDERWKRATVVQSVCNIGHKVIPRKARKTRKIAVHIVDTKLAICSHQGNDTLSSRWNSRDNFISLNKQKSSVLFKDFIFLILLNIHQFLIHIINQRK